MKTCRLQSGMVLTIEPGKSLVSWVKVCNTTSIGIYVPPLPDFPKHFHNIGIRIEVCPFFPSEDTNLTCMVRMRF